jgi:hypothetical protein
VMRPKLFDTSPKTNSTTNAENIAISDITKTRDL